MFRGVVLNILSVGGSLRCSRRQAIFHGSCVQDRYTFGTSADVSLMLHGQVRTILDLAV